MFPVSKYLTNTRCEVPLTSVSHLTQCFTASVGQWLLVFRRILMPQSSGWNSKFCSNCWTLNIPSYVFLSFCTMTNKATQLFHKLPHCYMFRHCRVILRQPVINTLPSYSSISNAAVSNTIYN
jgi:hypothetical protein